MGSLLARLSRSCSRGQYAPSKKRLARAPGPGGRLGRATPRSGSPGRLRRTLPEQLRHLATGPEARQQVIGIEDDPDGIAGERTAPEPRGEILGGGEVVDLQLDLIPVGVAVVERGGRPVVDAPVGRDAGYDEPLVGGEEVSEGGV